MEKSIELGIKIYMKDSMNRLRQRARHRKINILGLSKIEISKLLAEDDDLRFKRNWDIIAGTN